MNTLCALLPVFNAHRFLLDGILEILDVLSEATASFEVWILDDGSTDDTAEMAYELAARYPQIRIARHPVRLGLAEAIQTGLDHTQGELALVSDEGYGLDLNDLHMLWQLRDIERHASRHVAAVAGIVEPWLEKLRKWSPRRTAPGGQRGFQVISRTAFEQYRLQQAADLIMRIDRDSRIEGKSSAARPNYLDKAKRFVRGE